MAATEGDGNGWVVSGAGERRWGRFGAAGLLLRAADPADPDTPLVLLQHRAVWTASGGTWALPGGARDSMEDAPAAALRETQEEAEITPTDVTVRASVVTSRMSGTVWHRPGLDLRHAAALMSALRPDQSHTEVVPPAGVSTELPPLVEVSPDPVEWTYTTVVADAPGPLDTVANNESLELRWVPETQVADLPLMPAFAQAWSDGLRTEAVELVLDVANVLGSRPDGWWRDRLGSTESLLAEIAAMLPRTLELPTGPQRFGWVARTHAVVEGQAREAVVDSDIVVHRAQGSGDDAIADLVTELAAGPRRVVVVTADRGLRDRMPAGVEVVGPRTLLGRE